MRVCQAVCFLPVLGRNKTSSTSVVSDSFITPRYILVGKFMGSWPDYCCVPSSISVYFLIMSPFSNFNDDKVHFAALQVAMCLICFDDSAASLSDSLFFNKEVSKISSSGHEMMQCCSVTDCGVNVSSLHESPKISFPFVLPFSTIALPLAVRSRSARISCGTV